MSAILAWVTTQLGNTVVKIVVVASALLAPVFLVCWVMTWVELRGMGFDVPLFGHVTIAHGAIEDRDNAKRAQAAAEKAKGIAEANLKTAQANEASLTGALNKANASIKALGEQSKKDEAAAAARVAAEQAKRKVLAGQLAALANAKIDTSSPAAAALSAADMLEGVP